MARTDNLENFLTDVAAAIKSKKGNNTNIPAPNFDNEIINLPNRDKVIKDFVEERLMQKDTLPDNIKFIRSHAFYNSTSTLAVLPQNLTDIGEYAFYNCKALQVTEIPSGVMTIGYKAFAGSYDLSSAITLTFKGTPVAIASNAFEESKVLEIVVPWAKDAVPGEPWGATYATIKHPETTN